MVRGQYNGLKRHTLTVFEDRGWLSPRAWSVLADYQPIRSAYSYLLRLHRLDLLDRTVSAGGLLLYRLNDRGRARLAWLRSRKTPAPVWTL